MLEAKDLDGIPAFCRIPQAERDAAWERNPPKALPMFGDTPRRANLTPHDLEVIRELEAGAYTVKDALKAQRDREFFEAKAAEKAAMDAVRKAAAADAAEKPKRAKVLKKAAKARHNKGTKRKVKRNAKRKGT